MEITDMITAITALLVAFASLAGVFWQGFKIMAELRPNHGSSMRDAIDELHALIRTQGQQIDKIESSADAIHAHLETRLQRLEARKK